MSENQATDTRPPFFLIEDAVVEKYDLTPNEGWLYVVIAKYANHKTGEAFPSVTTLAKIAHMSKASVIRYTKKLEEKKLIRVDRVENEAGKNRPVNHYWLLTATAPGITQQPPRLLTDTAPVSDVDLNQSVLNQSHRTDNKENTNTPKPPEGDSVWNSKAKGLVPSSELKKPMPETTARSIEPPVMPPPRPVNISRWGNDELNAFYAEHREALDQISLIKGVDTRFVHWEGEMNISQRRRTVKLLEMTLRRCVDVKTYCDFLAKKYVWRPILQVSDAEYENNMDVFLSQARMAEELKSAAPSNPSFRHIDAEKLRETPAQPLPTEPQPTEDDSQWCPPPPELAELVAAALKHVDVTDRELNHALGIT